MSISLAIAFGILLIWTGFSMLKRPINRIVATIAAIFGFTLVWG